tara:strand:+ start:237 stop:491 length:255 start_codon:yes stop_codon:yes gene_type:complete
MVALTRLGLFFFIYLSIFLISAAVEKNIENHFQGLTFLFATSLLLVWIYQVHQDESSTKDHKEILYAITFLCAFTSLGSFLGLC